MAIRLADTARPNNHIDAEHPGTFPVAYAEDIWFADGTRLSEKTFDGQSIQVNELPLASATEVGKIYQFLGETGTYKHGYFYECIENDNVYSWEEKIISTDYPIKEVDTLPTGDDIENYIYSKRDSEYSLDIAGLSKAEIESALIANGFTVASTPHSYSYEFLITYPTPIDIWHPTKKKWLTPEDYDYLAFNKTNPPELAIVQTNAAGQKVTMYIGTYGDNTVLKYSDPANYYIGDSSRKSVERIALHHEISSLTNPVEYTSTIPAFNPTDTKDGVVIVFSGEDTNGFLQGHHYRWSENFSATIKECRIKTNAEGTYLQTYMNQDEELKVGTHLYTKNGSSYWCQTMVSAMTDEYITLYDVNTKQSTTYTYGYIIIEDSPSTVTISYDWVDIGGGGDGGSDYDEFIGTQDEWNALSQSQKDKYDGKIVNIVEDGESSTKEVVELTNYIIPQEALTAFPDLALRLHIYKYGRIIQVCCDNIAIGDRSLLGDYFKLAEGLPAPVYVINFAYPTFPDDSLGKNSMAPGYIGSGGTIMLRHVGMISNNATYLQGFSVVYLTKEA